MVRVDFHTHSTASPDGGLTLEQYRRMLNSGGLDVIAITDHNSIDFAFKAHRELGDKIIVGEEIATSAGELIGLYLSQTVPPGQTPARTAEAIHDQGGLVYVPHPLESVRQGLPLKALDNLVSAVDIVETHNGRALLQDRSKQAAAWARAHDKPQASGSDAHGWHGWGRTYAELAEAPTEQTLVSLLGGAGHGRGKVGVRGVLYPKLNRLRHKLS
jgi:predicted metal-dependent phosphoesterase TrpH